MVTKFKYKNMIFYNVKDNLFQTDKFGDKLIYKYEDGKYHLVKDERLSFIIPLSECSGKDHLNEYYIWKEWKEMNLNLEEFNQLNNKVDNLLKSMRL